MVDSVREEFTKNKELQDLIERETLKSSQIIQNKIGEIGEQISKSVKVIKEQVDSIADVRMYTRPGHFFYVCEEQLKMRSVAYTTSVDRTIEANPDATGVELHKESKWYASWKSFSENNAYYNSKVFNFLFIFCSLNELEIVRLSQ
ncbi:unnamed protein product [Gongylonema pulchrum]|uniref:Uncharacterized protein n=1 Tax=Gongylonema pulchrum TaxID=637853 RepID=A0A3P7N968_9BILA|nr:unnamed protein product [Gongylonema pulchrum]